MGCDGGTIPTRDELVRKKKKEEKMSKEDDLNNKWKDCAIAQTPLEKPIVSCQLGRLFSKESLIEFLIAKTSHPSYSTFSYIRNLKDVKDLKLTDNPAYLSGGKTVGISQGSPFICPVTCLEMSGSYKFLFFLTCGCVISERALREIKGENCPSCSEAFTNDDIIMLNGNEEEVEDLKARAHTRKLNKKKRKKADSEGVPSKIRCADASEVNDVAEFKVPYPSSLKQPSSISTSSSSSVSTSSSSVSSSSSSHSSSSSSFSSSSSSSSSIASSSPSSSSKSKEKIQNRDEQNSKDDFKNCKLYKSKLVLSK